MCVDLYNSHRAVCILRKLLPSVPRSQLTAGDQSECSACLMALPQVSLGTGFGKDGCHDFETYCVTVGAVKEGAGPTYSLPLFSGLLVLKDLGIEIEKYVASEIDPDSVKVVVGREIEVVVGKEIEVVVGREIEVVVGGR